MIAVLLSRFAGMLRSSEGCEGRCTEIDGSGDIFNEIPSLLKQDRERSREKVRTPGPLPPLNTLSISYPSPPLPSANGTGGGE